MEFIGSRFIDASRRFGERHGGIGRNEAKAKHVLDEPLWPVSRGPNDYAAFGPEAIAVMAEALEQACEALLVGERPRDREVIATRIIDLARTGVSDARVLSRRVIADVKALRSL